MTFSSLLQNVQIGSCNGHRGSFGGRAAGELSWPLTSQTMTHTVPNPSTQHTNCCQSQATRICTAVRPTLDVPQWAPSWCGPRILLIKSIHVRTTGRTKLKQNTCNPAEGKVSKRSRSFAVTHSTPDDVWTHTVHRPVCPRMGRDSSVGIATRYGVAGPRIEPRWEGEFSRWAMGPLCTMGNRSLSRGKSGQTVALTNHHHLAPRLKNEYSYTFTPFSEPSGPVIGWTLPFYYSVLPDPYKSWYFKICIRVRSSARRWEDNIKMDLQEVGWGMDRIDLVHDGERWQELVNAVMSLRVPQNVGNFLTSWEPVSFSRRTVLHGISEYFK